MRHLAAAMCCLCWSVSFALAGDNAVKVHQKVIKLMGSRFEITAVSDDPVRAWAAIHAGIDEIQRLENMISSWDPNSGTSEVNRQAGIQPVEVSAELFELIRRSKKISALTGGIFDISYASMDKLWRYDGSMKQLPSAEKMRQSVAKIDYRNIILDDTNQTVFLVNAGMKIGFGAIGKGFAANKASRIMQAQGITAGVVNAGGDLYAWGNQPDGSPWRVGITDPADKSRTLSWIKLTNQAVVTSGNYEKFVEIDGKTYGHIIHPQSGFPVSGTESVTIICPDAELADALATAVFILGEKAGIELIDKINNVECLLINSDMQIITSRNLHLNYYQASTD